MVTLPHTKAAQKISSLVLGLFVVVFGAIFVQIVFFNSSFGYSPLLQVPLLLCWLCFLFFALRLGLAHKAFLCRHKNKILALVMLFIFAVQFVVGIVTTQQLDHDYGKIYNGAVIFATQGGSSQAFEGYSKYFHHFTNNVGLFLFFQALFSLMYHFGLTCFYPVFVFLGHVCFAAAIFFTFQYLNRAFGTGTALVSLLLTVFFLPVYFQSSIAYTDTFSIWIPPLVLYCANRAQTTKSWPKKLLLFACIGLVLALAKELKATTLITGIALTIQIAVQGGIKRVLAFLLAAGLTFAGVSFALRSYTYHVVLNEERVQQEAWPVTYWVMMGLIGDGSYNHTDEWIITAAAPTLQTRTQLNLQHIQSRLQDMGPVGYLQLLHRKTCRTFGSGNADIHYLLVRQPDNPGHPVYQVISTDGRFFRYFDNLSQCVYLSFYVFGIAGAVIALRRKACQFYANFAPFLALAGFWLFMMLWESNHRLLVNQWPLFFITAAAGIAALANQMPLLWAKAKSRKKAAAGKEA